MKKKACKNRTPTQYISNPFPCQSDFTVFTEIQNWYPQSMTADTNLHFCQKLVLKLVAQFSLQLLCLSGLLNAFRIHIESLVPCEELVLVFIQLLRIC